METKYLLQRKGLCVEDALRRRWRAFVRSFTCGAVISSSPWVCLFSATIVLQYLGRDCHGGTDPLLFYGRLVSTHLVSLVLSPFLIPLVKGIHIRCEEKNSGAFRYIRYCTKYCVTAVFTLVYVIIFYRTCTCFPSTSPINAGSFGLLFFSSLLLWQTLIPVSRVQLFKEILRPLLFGCFIGTILAAVLIIPLGLAAIVFGHSAALLLALWFIHEKVQKSEAPYLYHGGNARYRACYGKTAFSLLLFVPFVWRDSIAASLWFPQTMQTVNLSSSLSGILHSMWLVIFLPASFPFLHIVETDFYKNYAIFHRGIRYEARFSIRRDVSFRESLYRQLPLVISFFAALYVIVILLSFVLLRVNLILFPGLYRGLLFELMIFMLFSSVAVLAAYLGIGFPLLRRSLVCAGILALLGTLPSSSFLYRLSEHPSCLLVPLLLWVGWRTVDALRRSEFTYIPSCFNSGKVGFGPGGGGSEFPSFSSCKSSD
jgi:hypothetical protein